MLLNYIKIDRSNNHLLVQSTSSCQLISKDENIDVDVINSNSDLQIYQRTFRRKKSRKIIKKKYCDFFFCVKI